MLETEEDIQEVLIEFGTILTFTTYTVLGIDGNSSVLLHGENSFVNVEDTEYAFYISTKDCKTNLIVKDNLFSYADSTYRYNCRIDTSPKAYADGWSRITAKLISRTAL